MSLLLRTLVRGLSPRLLWPSVAAEVGLVGTRCVGARTTRLGWEVVLRLTPPATQSSVERHADAVATALGLARVRATPDPARADRIHLALDLFGSLGVVPYPTDTRRVWTPDSAAWPVPLGVDDDGNEVTVFLFGSSVLIGGSPGAGKSTAIRALLAGLARQRDTALVGLDPKRVELTPWRDRLTHLVVGNEPEPTLVLLRTLVAEVQRRAILMAASGVVTLRPSAAMPVIVLVVDEWAELAAEGTAKQRNEAQELLRRFVSLGRAVGCSAILATQRPTSDSIDTGTRSLLAHRLALRCGDRWQSESILGQGLAEASHIPLASPGYGLLTDGGPLRGVQVYDLPPDRIPEVACAGLRIPSLGQ